MSAGRYGTVASTSSSRLAPTQPSVQQRRPEPTRSSRGVITTRNTACNTALTHSHHAIFSHTPLTTPFLSSLFTPTPPPHLADQRHSNLASNKPRQHLTRGKPRLIAPLPLLTPACLHQLTKPLSPTPSPSPTILPTYSHDIQITCVQLASTSAYCSILPSLGILLHTPKSTHNFTTCQIDRCHTPRFTAPQHPRSQFIRRLSRGKLVPL